MAEAIAFAAPRTEEMTEVLTGIAGAGITGVAEGAVIKIAPTLGALELPFTWGTLLGVPLIGVAGALFTRGILGDLFKGVAAAGAGIAGFVLPAMLLPEGLFETRRQIAGVGVKQLTGSTLRAPQRAQAAVKSALEF